jgi:SAM-dependent methyltransferase
MSRDSQESVPRTPDSSLDSFEFEESQRFYSRLQRSSLLEERKSKLWEIESGGFLGRVFREVERSCGPDIDTAIDFGGGSGMNLALLQSRMRIRRSVSFDIVTPVDPIKGIEYVSGHRRHLETQVSPGSVDLILAIEIIEHVFDTDSMIRLCKRLLKPGGVLVITTPNLSSAVNRLSLLLGWQPADTEVSTIAKFGYPGAVLGKVVGHIRVFTFASLLEFLRFCGLDIQKAFTMPRQRDPLTTDSCARESLLYRRVDQIASRLGGSLGSRTVVLARTPPVIR